ncbi:hypothetical protein Forpe1208_v001703 [Fusarium oxysporum f. sp. rapae]|uniref:Uncharacterized protein n=1 Tax=Fusarium oxysporum f. sp. rapae TaxID=485398 RepID=A0A8J5PJN5_FUSOX|nr:hypothetical protein Forpe1208_v001703 [Fusarium oxysporum f. sp. rapae]
MEATSEVAAENEAQGSTRSKQPRARLNFLQNCLVRMYLRSRSNHSLPLDESQKQRHPRSFPDLRNKDKHHLRGPQA